MKSSIVCLYCQRIKPRNQFNRGHVVPQAFGRFENNLVLHGIECTACNDYFGRTLELALARETKEGIDRHEHGLVKGTPRGGLRLGGRRVAYTQMGGPFDGAPLEVDPTSAPGQLRLRPIRAIGFGLSWDGPFQWLDPDELPPVAELRSLGSHIALNGSMSSEEAAALLRQRGLRIEEERGVGDLRDVDGKLATQMRGRIDHTILRAVAKIALSYLAHEFTSIAFMPVFDEIRRYIRFGDHPSFDPVKISTEPILAGVSNAEQVLAHVITVRWVPRTKRVVGQVSLLGWLQYRVTLSAAPFLVSPTCIDSGHVFNPFVGQVLKLGHDRRLSAEMPLMTKAEFAHWKSARGRGNASSANATNLSKKEP